MQRSGFFFVANNFGMNYKKEPLKKKLQNNFLATKIKTNEAVFA